MPDGSLRCSLNNRGKEGKKEQGGEKESVSNILLSCRIWFSTIKKGDIEECFSFHHFAVGNCFPHGALRFDVSPAAVTQVTARAVPVQMCYLSVSAYTMTKQKQLWPEGHQCFVSHYLAFNGKFLCFQLEKLSFFHGWKFRRNLNFAWFKRVPWETIVLSTGDTSLTPSWPPVWLSHNMSLSMPKSHQCVLVRQATCTFLEAISFKKIRSNWSKDSLE